MDSTDRSRSGVDENTSHKYHRTWNSLVPVLLEGIEVAQLGCGRRWRVEGLKSC